MRNLHVYLLAAVVAAIGLGVFAYKVTALGFPVRADVQANAWDLELKLQVDAAPGPTKVTMALPSDSGRFIVRRQTYVAGDYGVTHDGDATGNRLVVFSKRESDSGQTFYYRASVQAYPGLEQRTPGPEPLVSPPDWSESEQAAVESLLADLRADSAGTETLVLNLIDELTRQDPRGDIRAVVADDGDQRARAAAGARILQSAGIPARTVHGVALQGEAGQGRFRHWIEVYMEGFWLPYAVASSGPQLPANYLPWWRGPRDLVRVDGGTLETTRLSVAHTPQNALESAIQRGQAMDDPLVRFSLFSIPLESQLVYQVLLLVPVGALVLVVMRQFIGVETFGTFMPVLIALAFRQTNLVNGVLLFTLVVALGLMVRFYLERLKLLLVPRLASLLIVVVLTMAALSVLLQKLQVTAGLSLALFPMVILTMTIERMSLVWDEYGPADAIKQGLGSLAVAIIAYLAMFAEPVQYLAFTFPELLLVALALTLLSGRYTGYRLVELWRFRDLARGAT